MKQRKRARLLKHQHSVTKRRGPNARLQSMLRKLRDARVDALTPRHHHAIEQAEPLAGGRLLGSLLAIQPDVPPKR